MATVVAYGGERVKMISRGAILFVSTISAVLKKIMEVDNSQVFRHNLNQQQSHVFPWQFAGVNILLIVRRHVKWN